MNAASENPIAVPCFLDAIPIKKPRNRNHTPTTPIELS